MPDFPQIGCHAVAQYPSSYELSYAVTVQTAVDGTEQRFVRRGSSKRGWHVRLARLNTEDAQRVAEFFVSVKGRAASFRFQDPWTGQWHEPCWFDSDTLNLTYEGDDWLTGELRISASEV